MPPPGAQRGRACEPDPELCSLLARNRDRLVRRWLALVVERSSLDQLAERSLGERLGELELLFEAAAPSAPLTPAREQAPPPSPEHARLGLRAELDHQLDAQRESGLPFAVAILAPGPGDGSAAGAMGNPGSSPSEERWLTAVCAVAGDGELVLDAGDGNTAIVILGRDPAEARAVAERLRVAAWRELDWRGRLAGLGLAVCPDDGHSARELMAAAYEQLVQRDRIGDVRIGEPQHEPERGPASVTPLRPD
jgi:hypothetical protein